MRIAISELTVGTIEPSAAVAREDIVSEFHIPIAIVAIQPDAHARINGVVVKQRTIGSITQTNANLVLVDGVLVHAGTRLRDKYTRGRIVVNAITEDFAWFPEI